MIWIILKDLKQILWQPRALIYMVALPIVFTLLFAQIYTGFEDTLDPVVTVAVQSDDDLAREVAGVSLDSHRLIRVVDSGEDAEAVLRTRGGTWSWEVRAGLDASRRQMLGEIANQLLLEVKLLELAGVDPGDAEAIRRALRDLEARDVGQPWVRLSGSGERLTPKTKVRLQASAGMALQFILFGLLIGAGLVVRERMQWTHQRLLTSGRALVEIVVAHGMALALVTFLQLLGLTAFGAFVYDLAYWRDPFSLVVTLSLLSLFTASLGLAIGSWVSGDDQVIMVVLVAMFALAGFGGAWFPLEVTQPAFQTVGYLFPTAWAMDAFRGVMVDIPAGHQVVGWGVMLLWSVGCLVAAGSGWRKSG